MTSTASPPSFLRTTRRSGGPAVALARQGVDTGRRRRCRPVTARVVLAAGLCVLAGCGRKSGASAEGEGAPPTQIGPENVAIVHEGTLRSGPVVSGTLAPIRYAQLRAQVGGSVLEINAEQGQHVADGQVLARIDAAGLQDAFISARAAVASAKTAADYAARQAQRYDTLFAAGAVSDRDHESVIQQNAQAQSALLDTQARLVAAEKQLDYTVVRSPFTGIVADREVSAGDVVQQGTMLYSVVDPSQLQLQASVPAEQIASVHFGQPVSFALNGYGDRTFRGMVSRISPIADPSTREVRVYATIPNPSNGLVAGLFASGRVVTDSVHGMLVPTAAIDTRNLHPAVERVRRGLVERVAVQLGMRDAQSDRVQITAGVAVGDTLLRGAAQAMSPGTRVRVTTITDTPTAER
jgi:membrane fusion protein (multidrug efflux system)